MNGLNTRDLKVMDKEFKNYLNDLVDNALQQNKGFIPMSKDKKEEIKASAKEARKAMEEAREEENNALLTKLITEGRIRPKFKNTSPYTTAEEIAKAEEEDRELFEKMLPEGAHTLTGAALEDYMQRINMLRTTAPNAEQRTIAEQRTTAREQINAAFGQTTPPSPEALKEMYKQAITDVQDEYTAQDFLEEASDAMAERGVQYDEDDNQQERSMEKIVTAFNTITGHALTESEGWTFMSILKKVRQYSVETYHHDSAVDDVAYTSLAAEALYKESNTPKE